MLRELVDRYYQNSVYPKLVSGDANRDRELAHERFLKEAEAKLENNSPRLSILRMLSTYRSHRLEAQVLGLNFPNPLGVAAGFDKNARVFKTLGASGFGHVEVGSITKVPYKGNDRPRLFALPDDGALINRMGFPGDGLAESITRIIRKLELRDRRSFVLGVNIAASKPSFDDGTVIEDYISAFRLAHETRADYTAINLSSPNTEGVRKLQDPAVLDDMLSQTDAVCDSTLIRDTKPIFLKLSPDLPFDQIDKIIKVAEGHYVHGIIATNTTVSADTRASLTGRHKTEMGGISGKPLTSRALEVSKYISRNKPNNMALIRDGGVMTPKDYWDAISIGGADLVQVLTALVDERTSSPFLAYRWNRDLDRMLLAEGGDNFKNIKGRGIPAPYIGNS